MNSTPEERMRLFRRMHMLVEISQRFMQFCHIEPLLTRLHVRRSEFDLLMRLYNLTLEHPEGVSLKALTRLLGVSQSAASMTVGNLLQKGLVCRNVNPADRRQALFTISPAERVHFDTMATAQCEATAKILADLPAEKKKLLSTFIDEMYTYMLDHVPAAGHAEPPQGSASGAASRADSSASATRQLTT